MSLTVALREELAHIEDVGTARRLAEARAMVDLAGTLRVRGSDTGPNVSVVVRCAAGAVARRLRGTLVDVAGVPPGLARARGATSGAVTPTWSTWPETPSRCSVCSTTTVDPCGVARRTSIPPRGTWPAG